MKKLLVLTLVTGFLAGSTAYNMSGRQRQTQRHPETQQNIQGPVRFASPKPEQPVPAKLAQKMPTTGRPLTRNREEQARQLRLEIERALLSVDDVRRDHAYRQLLPALIKLYPAAVEQLVASWPAGPAREELLRDTAHAWSTVSVDGAVDWAAGVKEDDERAIVAAEIASHVAQGDPARAIGISDQFGVGRKDGTVERMVQLWAMENLQESLTWAENQLQGPRRDQLVARIATVQAETAPEDAARTALTQIGAGPAQDNAVAHVMRQWSSRDPDAAAAWIEGLPQGHIQDLARAAATQSARQLASLDAGSP
jgi:hypothetical protein